MLQRLPQRLRQQRVSPVPQRLLVWRLARRLARRPVQRWLGRQVARLAPGPGRLPPPEQGQLPLHQLLPPEQVGQQPARCPLL